jgi:hypothetical protein
MSNDPWLHAQARKQGGLLEPHRLTEVPEQAKCKDLPPRARPCRCRCSLERLG